MVGGSPFGWIVVSERESTPVGGILVAHRVGADGVVADAAPVELFLWYNQGTVLWDGVEYVVVALTNEEYYEHVATIEAALLTPDAATAAVIPVADGLGWPREIVGGCDDAGQCRVLLKDLHWTAGELWRVGFDSTGTTEPAAVVADPTGAWPYDAVRDGDLVLMSSWDVFNGVNELVWAPADPAPTEQLEVGHLAQLAIADDGVTLMVWTDQDGPPGDSGAPNAAVRVYAQRVQHGVGLLDATPFDLGSYSIAVSYSVAWTGASFAVAIDDPWAADWGMVASRQIARIGSDGTIADPIEVTDADPTARHGEIVAGPPGHLLWPRITCVDDDPLTSWCDVKATGYRIVEVDVPDGGACSEDQACLLGACGGGVCGGEPVETGGSGITTTPPTTTGGDSGDSGGSPAGCGCGSSGPVGAGWLAALVLAVGVRRRR
jgi:MYXO-CTERM domain-containing protein